MEIVYSDDSKENILKKYRNIFLINQQNKLLLEDIKDII